MKSKQIALAVGLFVGAIPHVAASPVWFVVDPARDFSWNLRELRKAAMAELNNLQRIDMEVIKDSLLEQAVLKRDNYEAIKITKITEPFSVSANNRSEEAYKPTSVCNVLTSVTAFRKAYDEITSCEPKRTKAKINDLLNMINNESTGDKLVRSLTAGANSESEKSEQFLQGIADMQENLDISLNQSAVMNGSESSNAKMALDVIFNTHDVVPRIDNGKAEIASIQRIIKSQIIKNQFQSRLNDVTEAKFKPLDESGIPSPDDGNSSFSNSQSYALAREQIRIGSTEQVNQQIEALAKAEMSPEVWRLIALQHSQSLVIELATLKRNIDRQRNHALTLKEL